MLAPVEYKAAIDELAQRQAEWAMTPALREKVERPTDIRVSNSFMQVALAYTNDWMQLQLRLHQQRFGGGHAATPETPR